MTMILWHRERTLAGDAMLLSLYVTLGVLLLLAVPNPSANRSLIAFAAWSSFAHATVMTIQGYQNPADRDLLWGSIALVVIGIVLLVLFPPKPSAQRVNELTS